ncbi:hypothetical protein FRC01_012522 [Tulasnella sp. 417]|nr:hypothetical protein FRC01_012522 [Tulasnella sp. 417]
MNVGFRCGPRADPTSRRRPPSTDKDSIKNITTNANPDPTAVKTKATTTVNINTFASESDAPLSPWPESRSKSPIPNGPPRLGGPIIRPPSPIQVTAKSPSVTRVTSAECQHKFKPATPTIVGSTTGKECNGRTSKRESSDFFIIFVAKIRFRFREGHVSTTHAAMASTHSLPSSPRPRTNLG